MAEPKLKLGTTLHAMYMQCAGVLMMKCTIFHCFGRDHDPPLACLWCLKGSVGSWWSVINVVKSWLYGVDLLLMDRSSDGRSSAPSTKYWAVTTLLSVKVQTPLSQIQD